MIHTEYHLVLKMDIYESLDDVNRILQWKVGDTLTVSENDFLDLQRGKTIKRHTRYGTIVFDKYNFENEVQYTEVTVNKGSRKLGHRKFHNESNSS